MAIQISGTEVISNSRGLNNIASVDATTAASISAAGVGGGGTYTFTADGAIAAGDVVGLNSDGTVKTVSATASPASTPTVNAYDALASVSGSHCCIAWHTAAQKLIAFMRGDAAGSNSRGYGEVATVSGTTVSYTGTQVQFELGQTQELSACYDSNVERVLVAYRDQSDSGKGKCAIASVSGTTLTFPSSGRDWTNNSVFETDCAFDSNSNKVVIAYRDSSNSSYGTAVVATVTSTNVTFGTPVVFSSVYSKNINVVFDSNSNKIVIAYEYENLGYVQAIVGTVSGTSISFGSAVTVDTASNGGDYMSAAFDSLNNKVVVSYRGTSAYLYAKVGTVSGTSISFGASSTVASTTVFGFYRGMTFDENTGRILLGYGKYNGNGNTTNEPYATAAIGTVSGTSITWGSSVVFDNTNYLNFNSSYRNTDAIYDPLNNQPILLYTVAALQGQRTSTVSMGSSNASDWIGISTEAISDTSSGSITVFTGVNEEQSGLTSGSKYYVADDGSLTTSGSIPIGRALSASKLLIDEGNA